MLRFASWRIVQIGVAAAVAWLIATRLVGHYEPFFAPIRENEFVVLRTAAEGPVVVVERLDRHRLDHGWRELPVVGVFEVHDGRITVWRDYFDAMTAARIHAPDPA